LTETKIKQGTRKQKIVKREIITDQSDPRTIEIRKSYGEFAPRYATSMLMASQIETVYIRHHSLWAVIIDQ
jgi:hypothetical protein